MAIVDLTVPAFSMISVFLVNKRGKAL